MTITTYTHTKHRPETKAQTQAVHMTTLLLKVLTNIKVVPKNEKNLLSALVIAFDEYPVENFYSVLRTRTKKHDTADKISFKVKEINECKQEMESFKSTFAPSTKFNFTSKKIDMVKSKAAEFLATKFEFLNQNPNMATLQPRVPRQPKQLTKWKLPNLFGDMIATNKLLPLAHASVGKAPNATR